MAPPSAQQQGLSSFKYGAPLYGVAWPAGKHFYVCGGGGSTATGIKNRVVQAECSDGKLSDQTGDFHFGADCPMRLSVSPDGRSLVVAMSSGGVKLLDLQGRAGAAPEISAAQGEAQASTSKVHGEVRCMAFSPSGRHLALGYTNGALQVLSWPDLECQFDLSGDACLADGVRDVDLSPSTSSQVAAVLDNGSAEVWDWQSKRLACRAGLAKGAFRSFRVMMMHSVNHVAAHVLPKDAEAISFTKFRFAPPPPPPAEQPELRPPTTHPASPESTAACQSSSTGSGAVQGPGTSSQGCTVYALMNNRDGSHLVQWHQHPETRLLTLGRYERLQEAPGACLELSRDGQLAAVGTSEGSVMVVETASLSVIRSVPNAHMVFSTGICFSADSQYVMSISADASAIAVPTTPLPKPALNAKLFLLLTALLLVLALVYTFAQNSTSQPQSFSSWSGLSGKGMLSRHASIRHEASEL